MDWVNKMELKKRVVILLQLELEKYKLDRDNNDNWQEKGLIDWVIGGMDGANVKARDLFWNRHQGVFISEVQKILYLTEIPISDMKEALTELRGLY